MLLDHICLVTGASGNIGHEIVKKFAESGGTVYANSKKENSLDYFANELNQYCCGKVIPIYFDITDSVSIKDAILHIKKEQGKIDVLVNNAGIVSNAMLGMISIEDTKRMFDVNVFGLLELTQLVATRLMMKQKSGSIINISSVVGVEGNKGQVAYSMSKGAIVSMTKSLSMELAPYGIRVNAVAPGMVDTPKLHCSVKKEFEGYVNAIGFGRWATCGDVADACLYFASSMSQYTTGQILSVAGGYTTQSRELFDIRYEQ